MPTFDENIIIVNPSNVTTIELGAATGDVYLGNSDGVDGKLRLNDGSGVTTIELDGANSDIRLLNSSDEETVFLDGTHGNLVLGGGSSDGDLTIKHGNGVNTLTFSGDHSDLKLYNDGGDQTVFLDGTHGNLVLGGGSSDGDLTLTNSSGDTTIRLNGDTGDITLLNADFAEDFSVADGCDATPGTLMALDDGGKLRATAKPYDKRVVGVVSGAGALRPGLVLDKQPGDANRYPISLIGKVYCLATAETHPIEIGDLLTSSDVPGHAMRAPDPMRAFGTIIGKAMTPLSQGLGLVCVLITLQ